MVTSSTYLTSGPVGETGRPGLWLSDAETGERRLISEHLLSPIMELAPGRLIAIGNDGTHGDELWVTDGTEAGTSMLKDIHPSGDPPAGQPPAGYPHSFTRLDDERALFVANDGVNGYSIWVTDGTADGTRMVTDLFPAHQWSSFKGFVPLGDGRVTFVASENSDKAGVWVTDGTAQGTQLLTYGLSYNNVETAVALGDGKAVYHNEMKYDGTGGEYWVTDGTAAGTRILDVPWDDVRGRIPGTDMTPSADGKVIVSVPGSKDGAIAGAIWITDGTKTGTFRLFEVPEGHLVGTSAYTDLGDGRTLVSVHGAMGSNSSRVWVTDGTAEGTFAVEGDWSGTPGSSFIPIGDGQAIHMEQEGGGRGPSSIWLFDGEQRVLLKAASMDNPPADLVTYTQMPDGRTLFIGTDYELNRKELWVTDGTAAGTKLIAEDYRDSFPRQTSLPFHADGGETDCGCPPNPETPTQPEVPTTPDTPAGPEVPTQPEPPADPEAPVQPEAPTAPVEHEWSAANGLFDVAHYLASNPDVAASGLDPLGHFLEWGAREGRDPNSHFDVSFYLNQNPDVLAAGVNALEHYMATGWKEGRNASFTFDGDAYLEANADVAAAGMNPLEHFLRHGEAEGRDAFQAAPKTTGPQNALVDASFYYATYGDVAKEGVDPTQHFMSSGWKEGRDASAFFDTSWYLATYQDVADAGVNPLEHYLAHGAAEHRVPSAAFDGDAYLAANADVAEAGLNPLEHYLQFGRAEGRDIFAA